MCHIYGSNYEIGRSNAKFAAVRDALAQNYNLPVSITSDIISMRKSLSNFNELINFWITKEIKPELISKYFTKKEIKDFDSRQYEDARPAFPLKLNMTQVAIDQWIGTIKISDLMYTGKLFKELQKTHQVSADTKKRFLMKYSEFLVK